MYEEINDKYPRKVNQWKISLLQIKINIFLERDSVLAFL